MSVSMSLFCLTCKSFSFFYLLVLSIHNSSLFFFVIVIIFPSSGSKIWHHFYHYGYRCYCATLFAVVVVDDVRFVIIFGLCTMFFSSFSVFVLALLHRPSLSHRYQKKMFCTICYMNGIISLYIQFLYCILNVNPMNVRTTYVHKIACPKIRYARTHSNSARCYCYIVTCTH